MTARRHIFILILSIFALYACNQDKSRARLPITKNALYYSKYDSCLFSIELRDSLLKVEDYFTSRPVKDFDELESFICSEIQNNHINLMRDYPIKLLIDSLTPYELVDKLIEELELMGFHAAYFKTANNGFFLVFPHKNDSIQKIVAELYGNRFISKKNVFIDCKPTKQNGISEELEPPPPPPPPMFISEYIYTHLYSSDSTINPELGLVEILDNYFHINSIKVSSELFKISVKNKKVLFIRMNDSNVYNDMIKLIDVIEGVQLEKYEHFSQLNYKKNYMDLSKEQSKLIRRDYGCSYYIISRSERIFYDNLN